MPFGPFRKRRPSQGEAVYQAIVAAARAPALYRDLGVPDTLEGRFEMVVLHAFLFFRRLRREDEAARAFGQAVFDLMFRDMDASLREIGVGDLSVPKKIRAMGEAFYGRATAYDAGLDSGDPQELSGALARNIFTDAPDAAGRGDTLARYVRACAAELERQPVQALTTAGPVFAVALREAQKEPTP